MDKGSIELLKALEYLENMSNEEYLEIYHSVKESKPEHDFKIINNYFSNSFTITESFTTSTIDFKNTNLETTMLPEINNNFDINIDVTAA